MSAEPLSKQEDQIRLGGGRPAIDRQHAKGRLTADNKSMAHLKLTAEGDIQKNLVQSWVKEAVRLNLFRP